MGLYKDFSLEDTLRSTLASMPLSDRDASFHADHERGQLCVKLFSDDPSGRRYLPQGHLHPE